MATHTLVAQAESDKVYAGWRFGYEVFDVDGQYRLVIHTSTYDGIRRDSHHATPEQDMDSMTREDAIQEAARKTTAYARALLGALVALGEEI